jgi:hypothetical protein
MINPQWVEGGHMTPAALLGARQLPAVNVHYGDVRADQVDRPEARALDFELRSPMSSREAH